MQQKHNRLFCLTHYNKSPAATFGAAGHRLRTRAALIGVRLVARLVARYVNGSCFSIPTQAGQNGPIVLPTVYGPAFFNTDLGIFKNFQVREGMKLQFCADGYNFINHPLWSFNGAANLTLGYNGSTGLLNSPHFGMVTQKQGHRVVQLAVKFLF